VPEILAYRQKERRTKVRRKILVIGIEIEPKCFDIACERIENAQRQERLFA
jgi:hypothetical protein